MRKLVKLSTRWDIISYHTRASNMPHLTGLLLSISFQTCVFLHILLPAMIRTVQNLGIYSHQIILCNLQHLHCNVSVRHTLSECTHEQFISRPYLYHYSFPSLVTIIHCSVVTVDAMQPTGFALSLCMNNPLCGRCMVYKVHVKCWMMLVLLGTSRLLTPFSIRALSVFQLYLLSLSSALIPCVLFASLPDGSFAITIFLQPALLPHVPHPLGLLP